MPSPRPFALAAALLASGGSLALSGCGNFFVYPGSLTGTTGSSTTDYVYASNSTSGAQYLAGYSVGSGALTAATGAPYSVSVTPLALAVTPSNKYLYAATTTTSGTGLLYGFAIGTGGALTSLSSGLALETENIASMDISPDGQYLFALDANGLTISEYLIASTGALTFGASYNVSGATGGTVAPVSIRVAPSGTFFVVALGTGGVETFSFNTSTGVGAPAALIAPAATTIGIFAVAADANNYLYAAGTVGLQVFSVTSAGIPTLVSATPYATGSGPVSIALSKSGGSVYTANSVSGSISGFTVGSNGVLTTMSGSPFAAPAGVSALVRDSTGNYLFATGYSATNGYQLYTIASTGVLSPLASAASATATSVAATAAATH